MQPSASLCPGDRVPDFQLPDHLGTRRIFYNEVRGRPLLLFVAAGLDAAATAFQVFASRVGSFVELGADCLVVTGAGIADNAALLARCGIDLPAYSDPQRQLVTALLAMPADVGPASFGCYLLDPNQRVLSVVRGGEAEIALDDLQAALQSWSRRGLAGLNAPALILPNTLEPELCKALIAAWQAEHHEGSFSTGRVDASSSDINAYDPNLKKTLEHVVSDQDLSRRATLALARRIGPELAKVFNYAAPFRFDAHVVMRYRPERGDFFGMHRDNLRQQNKRRFAVSLNLNDDFEGGELHFPEYSGSGIKMAGGTACVFSCALLHEARQVTRGERFVLTNFFCDPDQPDQRIAPDRRRQMQV